MEIRPAVNIVGRSLNRRLARNPTRFSDRTALANQFQELGQVDAAIVMQHA
jgi:hypothetical protein